jgi:DNA-binding MarR family transcriptional regulator
METGPTPHATPGYLIWRVAMKFRTAVDRELAPLGLTHAQYTLLASLYGRSRDGSRPSQRELADHVGLEPVFVSKLVRALESAGLLDRAAHPTDARAVRLELTETGTARARAAIDVVRTLTEQLTAPLGGLAGERTHLLSEALTDLLHAPEAPETPETPETPEAPDTSDAPDTPDA